MHVLVTGGAGFIGAHACKALSQAGFTPVAYDNLSTGHAEAVRYGPLVRGDVCDRERLCETLRAYSIEAVLHFAASAYVGESVANPGKYYANNVGGMIQLLGSCKAVGIKPIVFSSSCATYGIPDQLPIQEESLQRPINPYGRTKLICEEMLRDYAVADSRFRYVCLRYFNAAGADPEGEIGERHNPETHLIPLALLAAARRGPSLDIFGTDYDTPDGTCIRDYIHVSDLARAHVLALKYLMGRGESLAVNLGTGRGYSVREIVAAVAEVTGHTVPVREKPRRIGDPPILTADPSAASRRLGFTTRRSDLPTILRDAAPWFLGNTDHAHEF